MNHSNQTTIASYNDHVQEYIDNTPQDVSGAMKEWIDASLEGLSFDAKILEFGSAFGRDADYIEAKGYKVICTDVTPGFVELLRKQGRDARILNAITDELPGGCDLIFADAVLLHFTRDETAQVAKKVLNALSEGGRFAFTLKKGDGEEVTNKKLGAPRYFCYWQADDIRQLLINAGFSDIQITDGGSGGYSNAEWLQVIANK